MFATSHAPWIERLRRAAALVKAFALLEEPPRSAPAPVRAPVHAPATNTRATRHSAYPRESRTHPHRAALVAPAWDRRPGAPPRPVQACTMPLVTRVAGGERTHA
jgi:hypothetical protein